MSKSTPKPGRSLGRLGGDSGAATWGDSGASWRILAPLLVSLPSWCCGFWWLLLAPRGCWYPLVAHVGFLWRQWYSIATPWPLYCRSSATLRLPYSHSPATPLPLYCHSAGTKLARYYHSPATWDHGSPNLPHPTPTQAPRAPMQRQKHPSSPLTLS